MKTRHFFLILFASASLVAQPLSLFPQEKRQARSQGKETPKGYDEDFLLEPRRMVQFRIEHLLIKPAETIPMQETTDLMTEIGCTVSYSYIWPSVAAETIGLEITPSIAENKGIDLKISIKHNGQTIKEEVVRARNFEPVVVELLESKKADAKLADRITPLIQVVYPPQKYPKSIHELELVNDVLIMNDTMLLNNSSGGGSKVIGGSETEPCFIFFWVKGKGIYILSFWPLEGADPIGVVSSNTIRIRHNRDYFALVSMKPILPEGKWRVWVRNNPSYNPAQDILQGPLIKQMEKIRGHYEIETAAITGVACGQEVMKRFLGK